MTSYRDILMTLPIELQYRILQQFTLKERIQLFSVSKLWRSTILNAPVTWNELHFEIDREQKIEPNLQPYQAYIKKNIVKRISIGGLDNINGAELMDFLVNLKCDKLQELHLEVKYLTTVDAFKLVSMCGSSLTRVYIEASSFLLPNGTRANVTPGFFLDHCPNLKKLHFSEEVNSPINSSTTYRPPNLLLTDVKHQHLTDLTLDILNIDLSSFLKATPKIERLCVSIFNILQTGAAFADQLLQLCPRLKTLHAPSGDYGKILMDYLPIYEYEQDVGLSELYFETVVSNQVPYSRILCPLISSASKTLVALHISGPINQDNNDFQYLSRCQLPSLRQLILNLTGVPKGRVNDIHQFIKINADKLTVLELLNAAVYMDNDLLKIITAHAQKLQRIKLHEGPYTSEGLTQFLESMVRSECSLKYLSLICANQAYAPALQAIVAISRHCTINELELRYGQNQTAIQDLEQFLEAMMKASSIIDFVYINFSLSKLECEPPFIKCDRGKAFIKNVNAISKNSIVNVFQPHHTRELIRNIKYQDTSLFGNGRRFLRFKNLVY